MTTTAPKLRWSSARDCPRKAIYDATEEPERERTLGEERILARGRGVGRDYLVQLCSEKGWSLWAATGPHHWIPPEMRAKSAVGADVVAELPVKWAYGVGHADAWITTTDTILEVLSSQAGEGMRRSKELQATLYTLETGANSFQVTIVNPVDLSEERTTVTRGSKAWPGLVAEVEARIRQLDEWSIEGALPPRVCSKPSEARGHWCLHQVKCFEGWEPEPLELVSDPQAIADATRHFALRLRERELSGRLKSLEEERKLVEASLAERIEPGTFMVGEYEVTRSPRQRRNFRFSLAERDDRFPDALLEEYTTLSSYEVFTTKLVEGEEGRT